MAGGSSSHARHAWAAIRRLASSPRSSALSSTSATCHAASRSYSGSAAAANSHEFWVVEGEILRINRDHRTKSLLKIVGRNPPNENLNLSRKKVALNRLQRVMATRISKSERGQEEYWKTYLQRFQSVQQQWENLYWDEVPQEKPVTVLVDRNDPFTILGLKRRDKPYSPVELKSAYREMALKYHPDHNPGKDAEVRFERIWNAYKMLQHKRSWR